MDKKVKISKIVDAMEMQSEDSSTYFNKENSEFLFVSEDVRYEAESNNPIETEKIIVQLIQSIKGGGAFRRFKDTLYSMIHGTLCTQGNQLPSAA